MTTCTTNPAPALSAPSAPIAFEFDGTKCTIKPLSGPRGGYSVTVYENGFELYLTTTDRVHGADVYAAAIAQCEGSRKMAEAPAVAAFDPVFVAAEKRRQLWVIDRVCYVASLAARRLAAAACAA